MALSFCLKWLIFAQIMDGWSHVIIAVGPKLDSVGVQGEGII